MGRAVKKIVKGKLVCSRCREDKPVKAFAVESSKFAGYSSFCKACSVFKRIESKYGLNREDAEAMMEKQASRCNICGDNARLVVDHCHATNKVRGFLCSPCNTGLGFFRDLPLRLRRAAQYLEKLTDTRK